MSEMDKVLNVDEAKNERLYSMNSSVLLALLGLEEWPEFMLENKEKYGNIHITDDLIKQVIGEEKERIREMSSFLDERKEDLNKAIDIEDEFESVRDTGEWISLTNMYDQLYFYNSINKKYDFDKNPILTKDLEKFAKMDPQKNKNKESKMICEIANEILKHKYFKLYEGMFFLADNYDLICMNRYAGMLRKNVRILEKYLEKRVRSRGRSIR